MRVIKEHLNLLHPLQFYRYLYTKDVFSMVDNPKPVTWLGCSLQDERIQISLKRAPDQTALHT
jgi:hypothetical protein